jgi:hypothetical protein
MTNLPWRAGSAGCVILDDGVQKSLELKAED